MYPGSIFNLYDQSAIPSTPPITDNTYRPLFLSVGSFDKGYEGFNRVYGKDFYRIYGSKMYFSRHGQNAIQTANLINAGAECLIYRVVAEDSTLANFVFVANVTEEVVQKTDKNGNPLYYDIDGNETTVKIRSKVQRTDGDGNLLYIDPATMQETTDATHEEQKKDADGNLLYIDPITHQETTSPTHEDPDTGEQVANDRAMEDVPNEPSWDIVENDPVMVSQANVKWETVGIQNATKYEEVVEKAMDEFDPDNGRFPLMIFTDIGRGASTKAIKFIPNYATSQTTGLMFYNAVVFEGTTQIDNQTVAFNPRAIYMNTAYGLSKDIMTQVNCAAIDEVFDSYVEKLSSILNIDESVLINYDLIFGYNLKGSAIPNFHFDNEGSDLRADYGLVLSEGSNGSFGESPITEAYDDLMEQIRQVYAGVKDERIYDVDEYRIVAVLDAAFSDAVKDAIGELATFRQDFMFFRDLGLDVTNLMEITDKAGTINKPGTRNRYTTVCGTTYQIFDPQTYRRITVTANYDLATCLVKHFTDNAFAPLAGQFNGFVLDSAIEDTINFVPINTPDVKQKQVIDDLRVNYAIFQGNLCTMQSEYTIQDEYTELSFTNNVIAIQEIMRAIRKYCPKIRFMTVDGYDMTAYAKAVNDLLSNYSNNFYRLYFEYTADKIKAAQKIFYATIKVQFRPWEQTEEFDIFALGLDDDIEASNEL